MAISVTKHARNARILYKTCLRLHRGLPLEMQAIGDAYVRDEFKRHKDVDEAQRIVFMEAWTMYALKLSEQLGPRNMNQRFGHHLGDYDSFSDDQLCQLYELYKEASKKHE